MPRPKTNTDTGPLKPSSLLLTEETKKRLADICHKSETYDALINKLIDHYHNFTINGGSKKDGKK